MGRTWPHDIGGIRIHTMRTVFEATFTIKLLNSLSVWGERAARGRLK